jgi:DNA-binding LytR/AlgR family response regulator
MTSPKVLIVEDEPIIAQDLKECLSDKQYSVAKIARSYEEAVRFLEADLPNIVLVDIVLKGEKDGIELATFIRKNYHLPIVFITSHSESSTVRRAAVVKPEGYLVKPFKDEDIYTTVEIALSHYQEQAVEQVGQKREDVFFIRHNGQLIKLKYEDVIWLKADGNYTEIWTVDKKKYMVRNILKEVGEQFPVEIFMRVHKSYIVRLSAIDAIKNGKIVVLGMEIPVARSMYEQLISRLNLL